MSALIFLPLLAVVAALIGFFALRFLAGRVSVAAAFAIWFAVVLLAWLIPYLWKAYGGDADGFRIGLSAVAVALPLVIGGSLGALIGLRRHFTS